MKRRFKSWIGWLNYHIFWTGFILVREYMGYSPGGEKDQPLKLRRIKKVYGHNDKSKIWMEE